MKKQELQRLLESATCPWPPLPTRTRLLRALTCLLVGHDMRVTDDGPWCFRCRLKFHDVDGRHRDFIAEGKP